MIKPRMSDEEKRRVLEELLKPVPKIPKRTGSLSYSDLEIEPGKKSEWKYFNDSLAELRERGYERHLMPWESFGLVIDYLEGKLDVSLNGLAEGMLSGFGEWFDFFTERKENKLFCYVPKERLEPEDVQLDSGNRVYVINRSKLVLDGEHDIGGILSEKWVDLEKFPESFVTRVYTRKFSELPQEIREGVENISKTQGYLAPEGRLWPAGRGSVNLRFDFDCYLDNRASRGVRENFSTGNRG